MKEYRTLLPFVMPAAYAGIPLTCVPLNQPAPQCKVSGKFGDDCFVWFDETVGLPPSLEIQATGRVSGCHIAVLTNKGRYSVIIGSGDRLVVGPEVRGKWTVRLARAGSVVIGRGATSVESTIMCVGADIEVGEDCMFSSEVLLQGHDQHPLIDLATMQILNDERKKLVIADHVWLGRRAMVLPGVTVGAGTVVGAGAVVAKDIAPCSLAVGVPARAIRKNVSWARNFKVDGSQVGMLQSLRAKHLEEMV